MFLFYPALILTFTFIFLHIFNRYVRSNHIFVPGTAADILKNAVVYTAGVLNSAGLGARVILLIHDEIVWEVQVLGKSVSNILSKEYFGYVACCSLSCQTSFHSASRLVHYNVTVRSDHVSTTDLLNCVVRLKTPVLIGLVIAYPGPYWVPLDWTLPSCWI